MASKKKREVPKPSAGNVVGSYAFIVGFILAVASGFFSINFSEKSLFQFSLIAIGILIGFLNVYDHEAEKFVLAGIGLVLLSWLGRQTIADIPFYFNILSSFQLMFVPATLIVALRQLFIISHK